MGFVIGAVLALVVGTGARFVGLDRDRAFYPTVLMVVASYYVLFAAMGGSTETLFVECAVMGVFVAASLMGFKRSLWIVVIALAGHGIFDFVRGGLIENPGVPSWWPSFCMAYDVVAAACLAVLLRRPRPHAVTTQRSPAGADPAGGDRL